MGPQVVAKVCEPEELADGLAPYGALLGPEAREELGFRLPALGQYALTLGALWLPCVCIVVSCGGGAGGAARRRMRPTGGSQRTP